jgi:hypothetical protein
MVSQDEFYLQDFLEEFIESTVAMSDNKNSLCREVMVEIANDLIGNFSFSSARRTDNDRQSVIHS